MKRLDQWLTTVGFCAFLGIMSILFFVLPKQEMSETEKRVLEKAPEFSWENLTSGKLGGDIESYMADHVPGRDFFVGLHNYTELLTGRQVTKDIYLAEGDRLVERPLVWDDQTAGQVATNMTAINTLARQVDAPVDLVIVPSAGWAVRHSIVGLSDEYTDPELIKNVYAQAGAEVNTLDLTAVFGGYENPGDLYYRTDHHWTSLGAYTAYKAYMNSMKLPYRDQKDFTVETVEDFKGTTHSRAALWLVPGEPLEMWTGSKNIKVQMGDDTYSSVFFKDRLQELDKYTVFLDGNKAQVVLENPDAPVDETLLVVRDSYSNCLASFLAETYKRVVLVDLRYYNESVADYCKLQQVDRVLVLYSLYNFTTDTNISRLSFTNTPNRFTNAQLEAIEAFEGSYYDLPVPGGTTKVVGQCYRVSYMSDEYVALVLFDAKGNMLSNDLYAMDCTLADFDDLQVGDSVEKVKQLHPTAYFPPISTGKDRVRSEHYTTEGVMVTIYYENDLIAAIEKELL